MKVRVKALRNVADLLGISTEAMEYLARKPGCPVVRTRSGFEVDADVLKSWKADLRAKAKDGEVVETRPCRPI